MCSFAGKYYLVDSGYLMRTGFLAPYKGERYHIGEFRPSEVLHCLEERFNYLHSSLHSIIERTFGVWKNKRKIWRHMPPFKIHTQNLIIVATMVLHNFVKAYEINNDAECSRSTWGTSFGSKRGHYDAVVEAISILDEPEMKQVRIDITTSICADNN